MSRVYLRTFTGREVNPLDLQPSDIDVLDVAHHLALINRFNGAVKRPISVAQHSVYVYRIVCALTHHMPVRRQALFHDGGEAYVGDVTKWLKHSDAMAAFREAEDRAQATVFQVFDCPAELHEAVEYADRIMVRFEGMKGFGPHFRIDHPNYPPLTDYEVALVGKWQPWSWRTAEEVFLAEYRNVVEDNSHHVA